MIDNRRRGSLLQRLSTLIDGLEERLSSSELDFAHKLADHGEWELAIATIREAERQGDLRMAATEQRELIDLDSSLSRLERGLMRRIIRRLLRGPSMVGGATSALSLLARWTAEAEVVRAE